MDPSYPYAHGQQQRSGSRSLASTTDAARYQQPYQQYSSSSAPPAGYVPSQGGSYDPSSYPTQYYLDDPRRASASAHASASYPGAAQHSAAAAHYSGGRGHAASAPPAGHPYAAAGQPPLSPSHVAAGYAHSYAPGAHAHAGSHPPHSAYGTQYLPTPASLHAPHHSSSSSSSSRHRTPAPGASAAHGVHGYGAPPSPEIERFPCDKCDKTFSRAHDRKRHCESQHAAHPYPHRCRFCLKEFSRADSLKRHVDNGCEKDPEFNVA